jgi:hypothetical protein
MLSTVAPGVSQNGMMMTMMMIDDGDEQMKMIMMMNDEVMKTVTPSSPRS